MEKLPEQNCSENGGWLFQNIHLCFQVLTWQECNMEGNTGPTLDGGTQCARMRLCTWLHRHCAP